MEYRRKRNTVILFWCEVVILCSLAAVFILVTQIPTDNIDDTDISTRIEKISQDLAESSSQLSNIQRELEERIQYVEELKAEAEVAENVISMTEEQVSAVQAKLNQELESSSTKGMIQSILIGAFFFVLGYIVQPIHNWFKRKIGKITENNAAIPSTQYSAEEIERAIDLLDTIKQKDNSDKK